MLAAGTALVLTSAPFALRAEAGYRVRFNFSVGRWKRRWHRRRR